MGDLAVEARDHVAVILAEVRPLVTELYHLSAKLLGMTGEVERRAEDAAFDSEYARDAVVRSPESGSVRDHFEV